MLFERRIYICPHSSKLLTPAIKCLLGSLNLPDRINTSHPLPDKHFNLTRFWNGLFPTMSLDPHNLTLL